MSGAEAVGVVGMITGIVSAFTGAYTAFTKWRKKRKERKQEPQNQTLEVALRSGASEIQSQFARCVELLGPRFERGDGDRPFQYFRLTEYEWLTSLIDMARDELWNYRIQMQQTFTVLNRPDTLKNILLPNSPALIYNTDQTRHRTLLAIRSQYQRMMQAAPLTRTELIPRSNERQLGPIGHPARPDPLPNTHSYPHGSAAEFCDGAIEFNGSGGKWQCSDCSFQAGKQGFRNTSCAVPTRDAPGLHLHSWMILTSHLRSRSDHRGGGSPLYGCQICPQPGHFTESDLKIHLQQHTRSQLHVQFGRSVQVCDCGAPHGRHRSFCAVMRLLDNREEELERVSNDLPLHRWMSNRLPQSSAVPESVCIPPYALTG